MKKLKNHKLSIKKPNIRLPRRRRPPEERVRDAFANIPKITDETISKHREDVLSSARKYIYPLQHSRKRIVWMSTAIITVCLLGFFIYTALALYKFQQTNSFIYGVTQVIPLPVAKVGNDWISYESYLFELRRYMHYYETQQQVNFSTKTGQAQLSRYKQQAMSEVITDAYTQELAAQAKVSVSDQQVNQEVAVVQNENRLGSSQQELDDVLHNFWGWNEADFKRELKQQMLQQAVAAKLDVSAYRAAQSALMKLKHGMNFAKLASLVSDDTSTKNNGGEFSGLITENDPNISPILTATIFRLKPGQISGIINTGFTLEIVKLISMNHGKAQAAHISFNLQPISKYIAPLEKTQKPHYFIHL